MYFQIANLLTAARPPVFTKVYLWGSLLSITMFIAVFFWEKTKADKSDTEHVRKIMVSLGYTVFWQFLILLIVFFLIFIAFGANNICLLYTSPSPRDKRQSRMPSSA